MRRLTRSLYLRVGLAALAGLAAGEVVLALLYPLDAPFVAAGIVAGILTVAVAAIAALSITRPIERLVASIDGDRRFAAGGPVEIERLASSLRRFSQALEDARRDAETERDRLATLLDELGEAILIGDAGGRIERANRAAHDLFGADLGRRPLVEVVRDHELLDALTGARPDRDTVVTVERTDPPRFQRALTRRLSGGGLLLVIQDLTAMRRLETVRRDFVTNVSHELRTPIASLKAIAETLESGALDDREAAIDFIRRMHGEIDGLAELVEGLLLITRFESGQQVLALAPIAPADLLRTAARRLEPLVERAGLRLVVEVPDRLPAVAADRDRVAQVLANLVHNATKHTAKGGAVHLSARRADGAVAFAVRDTGEGIAPHELVRIFERFYKSDRSRAQGGSGLGLSISKHIVEAHGGTIHASSAGAGGATFTFTLPVAGPR
jgi:two-component system phosphate regulon sensor histidine kinase PhoR